MVLRSLDALTTALRGLLIAVAVLLLAACNEDAADGYTPDYADVSAVQSKVLIFGVHPLHNPATLYEVYGPLMSYLTARLGGAKMRLEASRNYADFERKLAERHFQFALPNPYQTLLSLRYGYRVFGKMGDDDEFRGIFLVRKDHPLASPRDLRGKSVSYPAPTALAATMMPQAYLQEHGLQVMRDVENRYVGSQESSILNVFYGKVDAGATWPPPWRKFQMDEPAKAEQMMVQWQTDPLPNNGLVARDDVPEPLVEAVATLLTSLHESEEGRRLLQRMPLSRFEPANEATYASVRAFLRRFSETVRPIEVP